MAITKDMLQRIIKEEIGRLTEMDAFKRSSQCGKSVGCGRDKCPYCGPGSVKGGRTMNRRLARHRLNHEDPMADWQDDELPDEVPAELDVAAPGDERGSPEWIAARRSHDNFADEIDAETGEVEDWWKKRRG